MVEIPDPLPCDIDALQKLVRELQADIRSQRKALDQMRDLIRILEELVEQHGNDPTEAE